MADYWTQAAFTLDFGTSVARDEFLRLAALLNEYNPSEPLPAELRAVLGEAPESDPGPLADTIEAEGTVAALIWAETQLDTEGLARVLQHVMRRHGLPGPFGYEWAVTCSRPRAHAFGGGAVLVWPDRTQWLSTNRWLDELGELPEVTSKLCTSSEAVPINVDASAGAPEPAPVVDETALDDLSAEGRATFERNKAALLDALAQCGVSRVTISFDGYGDEGQIEDVTAYGLDGSTMALPKIELPFDSIFSDRPAEGGASQTRWSGTSKDMLQALAYDLLDHACGGWQDNEGAYGDFTLDVGSRTISLDHNTRFVESEHSAHRF